jgi:hypothetical protein
LPGEAIALYVLGENKEHSIDSWDFGFVMSVKKASNNGPRLAKGGEVHDHFSGFVSGGFYHGRSRP